MELRIRRLVVERMQYKQSPILDKVDGVVLKVLDILVRAARGLEGVSGHRCSMQCDKWLTRSMTKIGAGFSGYGKMR